MTMANGEAMACNPVIVVTHEASAHSLRSFRLGFARFARLIGLDLAALAQNCVGGEHVTLQHLVSPTFPVQRISARTSLLSLSTGASLVEAMRAFGAPLPALACCSTKGTWPPFLCALARSHLCSCK